MRSEHSGCSRQELTCVRFDPGCRYNFFTGCPKAKTCTIILRGGAEQFMEETERSLHDAIMIVRRAIKVLGWWLPACAAHSPSQAIETLDLCGDPLPGWNSGPDLPHKS